MVRLFLPTLTRLRHQQKSVLTPASAFICLHTTSSPQPVSDITDPQSLTISYLQKACGLSLESASSASKKLLIASKKFPFVNKENPDKVLTLLRNHGWAQTHIRKLITTYPLLLLADLEGTLKPNVESFASLGFSSSSLAKMVDKCPNLLVSDAKAKVEFFRENGFIDEQIAIVIMKRPLLLTYNAQKTFKPKLEFLKSLGLSESEVGRIMTSDPYILERSLEKSIIPRIDFLKKILGTGENLVKAIKASFTILDYTLVHIEPNMSLLKNHGVPESLMLKMFFIQPKVLLQRTSRLNEIIADLKLLGFSPSEYNVLFLLALRTMTVRSKARWQEKLEVYRSFGMSKDEVYSAFKRQPQFMDPSVKKIRKLMGFFTNELNLKPSAIANSSSIMTVSLEKRIMPRCSVLQILMSKGLVKRDINLIYIFRITYSSFKKRFVSKYQDVVPEVVEAYKGKIEFRGFPKDLEMSGGVTE
ncbi:hypothetical protein Tsubulata_021074 [Turnera subulata]|uniref:Uncharacterized protein n=1 Tax=Turnera subulata TaxID=218843 RepID=A0A9Q0FXE2_9ROSI|nr:hypothetical protein Tsubulata_021074 [Turnera subulata]